MSETSHTPGPWLWFEDELHPDRVIAAKLLARKTGVFDDPTIWGDPIGLRGRDRSLIAAAPDLLVALKLLVERRTILAEGDLDVIIARKAIAKAEGRK